MQLIFSKLASLKKRDELRKILANTGWLFFDRFLRMGTGLFVGVWVARYLGVEDFGTLNYVSAFIALFGTLSTLGLPSLVIRTLTYESDKRKEILGTVFWLQFFGGFLTLILALTLVSFLHYEDPLVIKLTFILGSAKIFQAFDTIDYWFQSQVQSKYTVIAKNIAFFVFIFTRIILVNSNAELTYFALAKLAEIIIGAIILSCIYHVQVHSVFLWCWSTNLAKKLLKESWPLILSGLAVMVYMKIDQIMLGQILDTTAVGLYSSAVRLSEVWYFIPTALVSSTAPSIYSAKKELDEAAYYKKIGQLLRILSGIAIVIAVPMSFTSSMLMTSLFGEAYSAAGPVLAIHIWAALFVFMGVGTSPWFIAEKLAHLSFRRTLLGLITNVGLNLILIPSYGGIGAAVATVISQSVATFFSHATHLKTRKLFKIQVQSLLILKT